MNAKRMIKYGLVLAISLLTACNGGIGGTGGKGGGGSKQAISVGTVTATGSVQVNGVTFDTSTATVTIDEISAPETALKQGMVVEVRGSINSETAGTADTVAAEAVVKGPITDMLAGNPNQIAVLKQLVLLDAATIFIDSDGTTVLTLVQFNTSIAGDLVEVSGFVKADGVIAATRIEKKTVLDDYKLKGMITGKAVTTFNIGSQLVEFSAADVSDLPGGVPANGLLVEVKASIMLGIGGELIATRVEQETVRNSEGSQIELEGYVTDATGAPGTFFIGSQEIQTSGATIFTGGLPADIRLGVEIEVEGQITGGVLIADQVEFESSTEVEADTVSVDAVGKTLVLAIGADRLTVVTNENTEISTIAGNDLLSDLLPSGGNHIQVSGSYDALTRNIIATSIEEKTADTDVILQGPVTGMSATTIEIMGVVIMPDATAVYRDVNDLPVTDFAAFQAMISVGSIVKAKGVQGVPILWKKLRLEY